MFFLDTNTVIHYFKGRGQVADRLLATEPEDIALPSIVLFELEVGVLRSADPAKQRLRLATFVSSVRVIEFGDEEARAAAQIRYTLEASGTPIGPFDTLIAGTAFAHHATLVTRNVREFRRVPGLLVANWFDPS